MPEPLVRWEGRTMGSPYVIQIVGGGLTDRRIEQLQVGVEQRLREINALMSNYEAGSELSRFNHAAANTPFKVGPDFARVIRFSLELSRQSNGAFDPTLGALINLWGFGEAPTTQAPPAAEALAAARALTGWNHLQLHDENELTKDLPGLMLNLGAVAKGFAVDELVRLLGANGLTNVYVSIAGEVFAAGHNAHGTSWRVGISAPTDYWRENDPMASVASISGQALSTSGDYQKFFRDADGHRYSHLLDPRTGRPVENPLAGVTVVGPDSMNADALGTTLFVLGLEEGMKLIEKQEAAAALFIIREGEGRFRTLGSSAWDRLTGKATPARSVTPAATVPERAKAPAAGR
ncbi:MAG: FAD:protein FMN transferase [Verrucomicrobiales bacterium]|nr:FAD:protein FMN transferase [Verrucomicrobiales bacterium]